MTQKIFTYSLIRAYYDEGKDYIDSFWPFVVMSIRKNEVLKTQDLQKRILDDFSLPIPIHSLNVILTRARRKGYVTQKNNQVELLDSGVKYQEGLEIPRDVERRVNQFLDEALEYLRIQHRISTTQDELRRVLENFLKTNAEFVEYYMGGKDGLKDLQISAATMSRIEQALVDYFVFVENSRPVSYQTLREMITGSIISVTLTSKDISEVTKGFSKTKVYLDTNIAFSILGLEIDEVCKPAHEMYDLLCKNKSIELRVFDFTVDEMIRVLRSYPAQSKNYVSQIKVRSIFSKLKTLKWTRTDLLEYIIGIEKELEKKKIFVEPTKIDLDKFKLSDSEREQKIFEYKQEQKPIARKHDLAAIDWVSQKRQGRVYQAEKAQAFFVTSDKKLTNYNYCEWGHASAGTIAEVIPDSVMTNMIWLKDPSAIDSISIESIISMYSRSLFIDDVVWSRFISIVKDLRVRDNIDDKDVALLLYDSRMQDELQKVRNGEMTDSWVLGRVEQARQQVDTTHQRQIETLALEADKGIEKISNAVFEAISAIKLEARNRAVARAEAIVKMSSVVLIAAIVYLVIKIIPLYFQNLELVGPYKDILEPLISFALGLLGWNLDIKEKRKQLINYLSEKINDKLLKESGIEKFTKAMADSE